MLSEYRRELGKEFIIVVLILVLMEYALWAVNLSLFGGNITVLILVLMEYALWVRWPNGPPRITVVLILVLMEYALWAHVVCWAEAGKACLNPCFNGICSLRIKHLSIMANLTFSLNPCFNGICSLSAKTGAVAVKGIRLNPCFNGICSLSRFKPVEDKDFFNVLILVLMEYALWVKTWDEDMLDFRKS